MSKKKKTKQSRKRIFFLLIMLVIIVGIYFNPYISFIRFTNDDHQVIQDGSVLTNDSNSDPVYDEVSAIKNNTGTIEERLNKLKEQDHRIDIIINHYDDYPEELTDMLSRNIDMLDFVLNYQKKKGKVYSDTIGSVNKGSIPLLLQWDERWGYANYGDSILAINGCGPTALSMVLSGLTVDDSITPYLVAKYAEEKGYYVLGTGTSWKLMSKAAISFGVRSEELPLNKNIMMNTLRSGQPIICTMGKGDFTTTGHFIVLTGIEDGKIKVNDPNSKVRSSLLWDYDRIAPQIRNLWTFYVK